MEKAAIDWRAMEEWSGVVFGNIHRLPVAVAALELGPDGVYPEAIKEHLGLPSSTRAKEQLDRFVEAGLLQPPRKQRTGRKGRPRKVYARSNDEFWDCLAALSRRRFSN